MHTVQLHIDEDLTTREMIKLKKQLLQLPHVVDVEVGRHDHHDLTVDYETHATMPMRLVSSLEAQGLHPDIISG